MSDPRFLPVLRVDSMGASGSVQDGGRPGWRRYGVPPGGWLDSRAAERANRLLDNPPGAPVLELFRGGQVFTVLHPLCVAVCGGEGEVYVSRPGAEPRVYSSQRTLELRAGDRLRLGPARSGQWMYLAVPGGFHAQAWLGSRGALASAGVGVALQPNLELQASLRPFALPPGIAARAVPWMELRADEDPSPLPVWPGPQAGWFGAAERAAFYAREWTVSRQCDRAGYRLDGAPLAVPEREMISEPQPVGTVQIARDGRPIVILPDGPAVGGYPKIGVLDPAVLPRLVQLAPGARVRFRPAGESP